LPKVSAKNHWRSQRFFEVRATKNRVGGDGFFVGVHGFKGRLRLPLNPKYPRPKVGFVERQKVKIYFLPEISAKTHWQSQRFFESKGNEKPVKLEMGFSLKFTGLKAGFACLQTPNIPGQK
jgi:hypothetical protein